MNTNDSLLQTSYQHRSLRQAANLAKPARFRADFDGNDRLDAVLRSLLIVCVLVSVMICGQHLRVSRAHGAPLTVPAATVEVTAARPVAAPAAPTASIL